MDVHAWFDDIFTGTNTVKQHNKCLLWVYTRLKDKKLSISKKKFDPFAPVLDILGCKVDAHRVHADSNKLAKLRDWRVAKKHTKEVWFLWLFLFLSFFFFNIHAYICSLQTICVKNVPFMWWPLHPKRF